MPQLTIQQTFDLALQHHQAGRLRDAEMLYQQILAAYPRYPDALHNMGVLARQVGQSQIAVDFFKRTIDSQPQNAEAHSNLGVALKEVGQFEPAVAACRQAIALRPNYAEAHYNLGNALRAQGNLDAATAAYQQAIKHKPNYFEAYCNLGIVLGEKGNHDQAITAYRRAISIKPDYAMAYNNLGLASIEEKQFDQAIAACKKAIAIKPDYAEAHDSLGNAFKAKDELANAIACYRRAVAIKPDYFDGWNNLGIALRADGQVSEAISAHRRSLAIKPDNAEAHVGLGNAHRENKQLELAIAAYQQAIAIKPDYAEAFSNLGVVLRESGKLEQAIISYEKALALKSDCVDAISNLGVALMDAGRPDESIALCRKAIQLQPKNEALYNNLGIALREGGQLDESIDCCRQALALKPDLIEAMSSLAGALTERGESDEAVALYRRAITVKQNQFEIHDGLLFTLNYHPGVDPQEIADEHRNWNRLYAKPLEKLIQPHRNDRNPDRRLRIGYVSPDFRAHAVNCFVLPLLQAHDHAQFEIYCYGQVAIPDAITEKVKAAADVYRSTIGLSDDAVAQMIRDDQIDILVDLAGHTAGNKMLVFAQKPAPVQVNYQGYPATTGLDAIDYRLTDAYADPPGMTESYCSEKLIRLPETDWCYKPLSDPPPVGPLPALKNGWVTFGSFNNMNKINEPLLRHWAEILQRVPNSKLLLKARPLRSESTQQRIRNIFQQAGVSPDRLDLRSWVAAADHLSLYNELDIGLDAFPYNGTTTTCEALIMGVPVVTFAGRSHVARVGVSLLSNLGLPELVGQTTAQFVQIAVDLANDLPRLEQLRNTLRQRMEQSPLMDGPRFARHVEAIYREIWRTWCASQTD